MKSPSQEQIVEWFESYTTAYFFFQVERLRKEVSESLEHQGFDTDSAERLMGMRANLIGLRTAFEQIHDAFTSKSFSELEEVDEQIGDSTDRGSGTD